MNEFKQITSPQNPLVKQLLLLKEKSRERRKSGLFLVEGRQELRLALESGYMLHSVFFNKEICNDIAFWDTLPLPKTGFNKASISREIYQKLAYRKTTEGVLALLHAKEHRLEDLDLTAQNPLLLVAQAPEKPGNIGALLRSADAAQVHAVIIVDPKTDLYNPNSIRSSVGALFTNSIALASTARALDYLKGRNISIFSAALDTPKVYTEVDFTGPTALVMGTESTGLSREWLERADQNIYIPMKGKIDSLNVSVSASILIFEALRQR
ncbi:MAG: RNA methyltransferase, partial [Bacteroidota bacterium]